MTDDLQADRDFDEITRIKARISGLVDERFASGQEQYYLSQLGNDLGTDRLLVERLTGQRLSEFITSEFQFEMGQAGLHRNVLFLWRPGHGEMSEQPPRIVTPRFHSRFWAAFVVPLGEDEHRFVNIRSLLFASDEAHVAGADDEVREIAADFIRPADEAVVPAKVAANIGRWLEAQNLDPSGFLASRRPGMSDTESSLLEKVIAALDGDQLRRVTLPLDVVRTLNIRGR